MHIRRVVGKAEKRYVEVEGDMGKDGERLRKKIEGKRERRHLSPSTSPSLSTPLPSSA